MAAMITRPRLLSVATTTLALATLAALTAAPARAGGPKAHVECTLDGGAKLKPKAKVALAADLWCSIVLDGGAAPDGGVATLWLEQPQLEHASETRTANVVGEDDLTYYQLDAAFGRGKDFLPCADVVAHGRIAVGDETVWSATVALAAKCKVKKLAAKLTCSTEVGDTFYKFPGNGSTVHPRMESELDCSLASKAAPPDGSIAQFKITHPDGTGAAPVVAELREYPQGGFGFEQAFNEGDYSACSVFTVVATVFTPDGAVVNSSKLKFAQDCPD